jgi:cytochrome c-type biogenesis protein CcmH/NrfG
MGNLDQARAEFVKYLELVPPEAPDRNQVQEKIKQMQSKPPPGKP